MLLIYLISKAISETLDKIWVQAKQPRSNMRRRHHPPPPPPRPPTDLERAWDRVTERRQESLAYQNNLQELRRRRPRAQTTQNRPGKPRKRRKKPKTSS